MKMFQFAVIAVACSLVACGGGGNSGVVKANVTSVKVTGASLADSGTFGFKFTVQSTSGTPYQVYTERVAATYGLDLCRHYMSANGGASYTTNSNCYNYAVAGSAINFGVMVDTNSDTVKDTFVTAASVPTNQLYQLSQLGAQGFSAGDLLVVGEGSANDTATLITAYLTDVQTAGTLNTTVFKQVITSLMADSGTTAGAGVLATDGGAAAGVAYMTRLAQTLVASVNTNALANGATRVVVINTLDVTRTPKLEAVLASLSTPQATQLRALFRAWINAYNTALNAAVVPYADKVVVVDLYTNFNAELDDLAQYGLTNKTSTVCFQTFSAAGGTKTTSPTTPYAGTIGLGDTDVTPFSVPSRCTDSYASSITPTETATGADWWKTYLFADNFHPTPYGHQLLARLVAKRLTEAGWL
jgi:outer membrane lipase/esterase